MHRYVLIVLAGLALASDALAWTHGRLDGTGCLSCVIQSLSPQ